MTPRSDPSERPPRKRRVVVSKRLVEMLADTAKARGCSAAIELEDGKRIVLTPMEQAPKDNLTPYEKWKLAQNAGADGDQGRSRRQEKAG